MLMHNAITTLVGEELEGNSKWWGSVAAPNGSVYGIPYCAGRVAKFNPVNKSMTRIRPDFLNDDAVGDDYDGVKWLRGAMTDTGIIYCPPWFTSECRCILKIDTETNTATELDANLLPERGHDDFWGSCAVALDGCVYFMTENALRIMKLDPKNADAITSVGVSLGQQGMEYSATVIGIVDGCVYRIPYQSSRILKFDPINGVTSFFGEEADEEFNCNGNGAVGRDGCIYALDNNGRVLKIDTVNNTHCFVKNRIQSDHRGMSWGWGDAILGIDGCIYWPPSDARRTLKYDPHSNQTTLVGDDFGKKLDKWMTGALATDGVIYCIPFNANRVLSIDPLGEFLATTKANMQEYPEECGSLFQTIEADGVSLENSILSLTDFDLAVVKFGQSTVFEVLEKAMKPVNDYCKESNLCPFMIAASYKNSPVCVINHFLRGDLSWVNSYISSLEGKAPKNEK